MALLYVTEYSKLAVDDRGGAVIVGQEPADTTIVSITGASTQKTLKASTKFVRLHSDAICNVLFGTNPTALSNQSMRMAANQTEFFGVSGGLLLAVISGT